MLVNDATFPTLRCAFEMIERDSGGHLIGTRYPGTPIDMNSFAVPDTWTRALPAAEVALALLRAEAPQDFETFIIGECTEQEAIRSRYAGLGIAHEVLNDFFNGWQPEDAPRVPA